VVYYTFKMSNDTSLAFIDEFEGIASPWDLKEGVRLGEKFPPTVKAYLDKRYGDLLTDYLSNTSKMVPISEKMKTIFEDSGLNEKRVEYLPFQLYNLKKRKVKKQYYIANALEKVYCIDQARSKLSWNSEDEINDVEILYLDHNRIPKESCFFRLEEAPKYIVIGENLVNKLKAADISGLELIPEGEDLW
jgi:hypothetical protein